MIRQFLNLFRREELSRDVSRELDFHIAERTDDLVASGMPREDAQRQARRQFGAYALHKEDTWMADMTAWLETLLSDARYALRGFAKNPAFAAVAILSLALGIGANTAIFSLIDAVMLRSLPVTRPQELVKLRMGEQQDVFSNPIWEQVRDHHETFSGVLAWGNNRFNISPSGENRYVNGDYVSGSYFDTLGVSPQLGRVLTADDDKRGCAPVAVLSHSFWMKEYGGDPGVLNRRIILDRHSFPIAGVSRAGFTGLDVGRSADVFIPLCSETLIQGRQSMLDERRAWWLRIVGRVGAGVSHAQIEARLAMISPQVFAATLPESDSDRQKEYLKSKLFSDPAANGVSAARASYRDPLLSLMVAAGLVLLIACANVANLLLARAAARQHEMAVRLALGASRRRLIRQTLTESLLLSGIGAALGLLFALWGSRLLARLISTTANTVALDLTPDYRVLLFTVAVGTVTGVLFGLLPAWRASQVAPNAAMKSQSRGASEGRSRLRLGKILVVAQVALSMVLLAGAGLMLATFRNLATLDPGFRAEGVLLVSMNFRQGNVPKEAQVNVRREILTRLHELPGVLSAGASRLTPISGMGWNGNFKVDRAEQRPGRESIVFFNAVTPGYFETMGTALVAGRDFNDHDTSGSAKVGIINESTAQKFFGKLNPLGHIYRTFPTNNGWSAPIEIVGVVRAARYRSLRTPAPPTAYIPMNQLDDAGSPNFEVRAAGSPTNLIAGIKESVAEVNPNLTMTFLPLSVQLADSLTRERMLATLSAFFGGLALLLAAVGLYGVLSYNVARRRNEIGIRMALGAARTRVMRMVLGEAGWLAGVGMGLGIAGTLAATQLVSAFLYGLNPDDPPTIGAAVAVLAGVAAVSAYLPARRAAMVDPMTALRDE